MAARCSGRGLMVYGLEPLNRRERNNPGVSTVKHPEAFLRSLQTIRWRTGLAPITVPSTVRRSPSESAAIVSAGAGSISAHHAPSMHHEGQRVRWARTAATTEVPREGRAQSARCLAATRQHAPAQCPRRTATRHEREQLLGAGICRGEARDETGGPEISCGACMQSRRRG